MAGPVQPGDGATLEVAASALAAQQRRMRVIAENIANADTTSTAGGGAAYRRQVPVFQPVAVAEGADGARAMGVRLAAVAQDSAPARREYDPGDPAADGQGYVSLPNVNPLVEALDMRQAQRAYEANLNVIETERVMASRTLDLLKR